MIPDATSAWKKAGFIIIIIFFLLLFFKLLNFQYQLFIFLFFGSDFLSICKWNRINKKENRFC